MPYAYIKKLCSQISIHVHVYLPPSNNCSSSLDENLEYFIMAYASEKTLQKCLQNNYLMV